MSLTENVTKGAELLDQTWPYWWNRVDPETVDVARYSLCPLAQASGTRDYAEGRLQLLIDSGSELANPAYLAEPDQSFHYGRWSEEHGFSLRDGEGYPELTRLWREAILERRGGAA